ncbi:MAG: hypothetical protein D6B28_00645 [Gammaproteobacteria bacterium]|nr:MAG: hypothetical protein D6B28_00645 [Gammaproteobacteria bacterium]
MLKQPRPHHYAFAHVALKMICDSDPIQFFQVMGSDEKEKLLSFLWKNVVEQCEDGQAPDFTMDDITIHTVKLGDYPVVLVVMPPVMALTEAAMVAIVLNSDTSPSKSDKKLAYRYFTLELGISTEGKLQAELCEWVGEEHVNLGSNPEPNMKAFLSAIGPFL